MYTKTFRIKLVRACRTILIFVAVFLLAENVLLAAGAADTHAPSASSDDALLSYKRLSVLGVLGFAFLIGAFGAACYYMGVYFGFIDRGVRSKTLEFLLSKDKDQDPRVNYSFFCFLGGVVATVFQSAQMDTLVPIQAFVLGATWPSVVNRMITGTNASAAAQLEGILQPGADVPSPKSSDANPKPPREVKLS